MNSILQKLHDNTIEIGSDESGKSSKDGDLVICGVYLDVEAKLELLKQPWVDFIKDSKKLSDKKIMEIAPKLKKILKDKYYVKSFNPDEYNAFLDNGFIQEEILSYGHNIVLTYLKKRWKKYNKIIVDPFFPDLEHFNIWLKNVLNSDFVTEYKKMKPVHIDIFENQADSKYPSVAIASIIARYRFLLSLED